MPSAAGIIIGDEILSGKFADENGPALIERARAVGADLRRIVTIRDDLQAISAEVRLCSGRFDVVITSGGVGPTHDDITLQGVALAFDVPIVRHPELAALLERHGLTNDHAMRMAEVPEGTVLHRSGSRSFPVIQFRNVWILPGIPSLFRKKLDAIEPSLRGTVLSTRRLYTPEAETEIAGRLQTAQRAHPSVDIGSYPRFGSTGAFVIVTLESRDVAALEQVTVELSQVLELIPAPPASL